MTEYELMHDDARATGCRTLVELLEYRASTHAGRTAFRFLSGDGQEEATLTYDALARAARAIAVRLGEHVVPGDRVLLLIPPGLDYLAAFFGCLYAGAVAVPSYPPNPRRADARVARIAADSGARVVLAPKAFLARLDSWLELAPELRPLVWLDDRALATGDPAQWRGRAADPSALAMLQFTSGSTGDPRGVMLTHTNLMHNSAIIHRVCAHRPDDKLVFWLPPFHDMGLIAGIVQPVYAGLPAVLMAPASFIQRPMLWLETMSRSGATLSSAPNFAYDLCVERSTSEERASLDLSSWRASFNGAEPVRADTLARFASAFAVSGLGEHVVMPCYGLAEATLFVSGGPQQRAPVSVAADRRGLEEGELRAPAESASAVVLVASGTPASEQLLVIVDPDTGTLCAREQIGEIWMSGASVAAGYWNRPTETAATFHAHMTGSPLSYLRTGDLGVLVDGQLVVTGRLKDLVIRDGRNYYPHDLEVAAERSHASLRAGYAAAFGVTEQRRERLILVLEVARQHKQEADAALFQDVRSELVTTVGIVPDEIVLIRQNTIPRTSSGKIQRRACRAAFLANSLQVVGRWRAPGSDRVDLEDAITAFVLDWIQEELQIDSTRLDPRLRLRQLGLDSLAATRLLVALEGRFGRRIDPAQLWAQPDLRSFAAQLAAQGDNERSGVATAVVAERATYADIDARSADVSSWEEFAAFRARLAELRAHDIPSPFFHVHEGVTGSHATIGGRTLVNFANYNYLGLSGDVDVTRASRAALEQWGSSVSASRVVSGEKPVHRELESEIARFIGVDDAIVYIGGHPANVSTIAHLFGAEDVILCDVLVHNSAMQGAEFSGARRLTFPHNDWRALDAMLARVRHQHRRALVVIEGVYSADGDIPDLARFVEVKTRHHAMLMVDEAHSIGVLGRTGRGISEHAGVDPSHVEIWMGTLSKSLASCGGYIAGSSSLVEYLKYTSPGFVYSVGITPSNAAAALEALRKLQREPERVTLLRNRAAFFLERCREAGLDTGESRHTPVIPVIIGDSLRAIRLSAMLFDAGLNVQPMVAPAVANDQARLRFFIACTHTEEELASAAQCVARAVASVADVDAETPRRALAPSTVSD